MNKRQKQVEEAKLAAESYEMRQLKAIYNKAAGDIAGKLEIHNGKISVLLSNYDKLNEEEKSILQSQIYQKQFQESLQKQINAHLSELNSQQYKSIDEYLNKCYKTGYIGSMYDIAGQGIPVISPIDQKKVTRAMVHNSPISEGLYTRLGVDTTVLKKRIANNIARGISTASDYRTIARNINMSANIGFNRAMRIARTEGHRIQCEAALDAQFAAKEAGADIVKQWDAALDGNTRETHRMLDGQIREIDEPFEVDGMQAMNPAGFGIASEDINCRCALLQRAKWSLDADELETLRERAAAHELYFDKDNLQAFKAYKEQTFDDFESKYLNAIATIPATVETTQVIKQAAESNALEDEALEWYVSGDGMWINQYLRNPDPFGQLQQYEKDYIKAIESATSRNSIEFKKLYRSVDIKALMGEGVDADDIYNAIKYGVQGKGDVIGQRSLKQVENIKGKTITEKGFMSTTKSFDIAAEWGDFSGAENPVVLEINVAKGTKGIDLKKFEVEGEEQLEVLLAKGQKYKVTDVVAADGNLIFKVDMLSGASTLPRKIAGRTLVRRGTVKSARKPYVKKKQNIVEIKLSNGKTMKAVKGKTVVKANKIDKLSLTREGLKLSKVEYNKAERLKTKLTESEIIKRLGGGDKTAGSCSSLAFAYIGNKAGFNVLDFRGGNSQNIFSTLMYIKDIANLKGVKSVITKEYDAFKAVNKALKNMESGKEYYLSACSHAAIIRKTQKGFEYLELQSADDNGFKKLTNKVLKDRFDAKKTYSVAGTKIVQQVVLIDAETLYNSNEFRKLLGYINTADSSQLKGKDGHVK